MDEDWVEHVLSTLSLDRKVGQLLAPRAASHYAADDSAAFQRLTRLTREVGVGGFVLFQGEVFGQALLVRALQELAEVPLLFGQDAEWGIGMRLDDATSFPSMAAIAATRDKQHAYELARVTALEARVLGVHHIYAPVVDVNNNPDNPIINVRSFGEDVDLVSLMATAVIRGLQAGGVLATAKHFPGHGDTSIDSHADLPALPFDADRLESLEWRPFRAAIDAGVASIMVGHLAMTAIDGPDAGPASLSKGVVTGLLRERLGFDGLVVSDALDMQGVQKLFNAGEAAVRCVEAGVDVLLSSPDDDAAFTAVRAAVDTGRISVDQIDASVRRILRAKASLQLVARAMPDPREVRSVVAVAEHQAGADAAAESAVTVLRAGRMLPLERKARLLLLTLNDTDRPSDRTKEFAHLLGEHHRGTFRHMEVGRHIFAEQEDLVLEGAADAEVVVVASVVAVRSFSGEIGMPADHGRILRQLAGKHRVVFVSFGSPYIVRQVPPDVDTILLGYGHAACMQRACAGVLTGRITATGRLPFTVSDEYPFGFGVGATS
jgi:beta-glucosidase-like glycosyl hydrolase